MTAWHALLFAAGLCVLLPIAVWSLECAAALLPPRRSLPYAASGRPRVVVLVPAHDEAGSIRRTLDSVAAQMLPGDRIVVIADNCTDETAAVARQSGAIVLERHDEAHRGKSYALDFGVRALQSDPPDVFVIIDADCTAQPDAVDRMARLAHTTGRPVQATYLQELPAHGKPRHDLEMLAFRIKNLVRPSGLDRLGLPCFLNGSGMAFPARVLERANLASGRIAEDRWLTVDLALAGHSPVFCREANVTSRLPGTRQAGASQRTRWLHGHLECMLIQGPLLVWAAIRQRRMDLFALALDLFVPPLSLAIVLWGTNLAAAIGAGLLGAGWLAAIPPTVAAALMGCAFAGVWLKFGGSASRSLLTVPAYILSKLPIYAAFLIRRERNWVRTGRDSQSPPQ
jgi:cellulose synthase/poly-beta-1,6-N-acetylglucosamine synthase-like glycosyltransferase